MLSLLCGMLFLAVCLASLCWSPGSACLPGCPAACVSRRYTPVPGPGRIVLLQCEGWGAAASPLHEGGRGRVKSGVCRETTVSKAATFVARYNNHSAGVYLLLTAASKYFLPLLLYYITVSVPATRIFH